jgi:hypothetical protein
MMILVSHALSIRMGAVAADFQEIQRIAAISLNR